MTAPAIEYPYRYAWGPRWPGVLGGGFDRKGQLCRILSRGGMNSALVEFQDHYQAVVSRHSLRRIRVELEARP